MIDVMSLLTYNTIVSDKHYGCVNCTAHIET